MGGGIKNILELSENENTTYQNLWDMEQAVIKRKFTAASAYTKK
jgi:hypothetical protein